MSDKQRSFIIAGLVVVIGLVYMYKNILAVEDPTAINYVVSIILLGGGVGFVLFGRYLVKAEEREAKRKKKQHEQGDASVLEYMEQEKEDHNKLMN